MTDNLDTRVRAASAALHESVRALPVEPLGRRTRAPQRGRLVLAAAAVVAVVALAISLGDRGPGDTGVATDGSGAVPRLVLDEVPPGMAVFRTSDLPVADAERIQSTYWVYGDAGADDPFGAADLGVLLFNSGWRQMSTLPPEGAEPTEVAGRSAWVSTDLDPLGRQLVLVELDAGSAVILASATMNDDELVAVAGQLDLDAADLDSPAALGGLDLVGTGSADLIVPTLLPLPATAGHVVRYLSTDTVDQGIVVTAVEGGEDALLFARWALGPAARSVEVRGAAGWSGSPFGGTSRVVIWQETPTVIVAVIADGLGEDAALDAARSLRRATDEEWTDLGRATEEWTDLITGATVSVPRDALASVSSGEVDGPGFAAYLDADGSLCLAQETPDGSSGGCAGGDDRPLVVLTARTESGDIIVYGHTTLGTGGELRITTDRESSAGSEAFDEGGTVFAFVATDDTLPAEIVVFGADGTELGRVAVAAPGPEVGSTSGVGTPSTAAPSG